ncbi:UDP-N-acetylmuramoylalanine--D-glutamate ligase [Aliarcobacter thereius]|uniref:UDP-N-acetylmuramoyl-L-alanine--D-glutamate ligase n=1 Tax=Aliarcobacter thereius TaxID=544718 RepID=UPI0008258017|nr:UDP-N-acetylmuramoyl-L-alanine--D-glutamate ligase [Aliarcobacter thereius]OCL87784.1 UDP-N-acetylmuramoylalanine--D-glutamate ligase [Aliarcobacter thereius]OCL94041.1 UDP-N-acetylmuramoylalanine--D-glutamate ligase [Aliarcobacter thereius]TLT08454.1 UDP-N-acetylmuramoyl-L-alanine--D-glutamate ligase [Aliarcobacter thereius]
MKKIRILGKGKTALALKEVYKDAEIFDDSEIDLFDKESDTLTVVSPGIPPNNILVKSSINLISDYDLFYEEMPFSIWISGTNGKTTTTQMCQVVLEDLNSSYGGNIGIPLSKLDKSKNIWILETSSFTLHYTKEAKPNIYILLPISHDHITWHGSYEAYKEAKLKPLKFMQENDIAIIPSEFKDIKTSAHLISYSNSDDLCEHFKIDKEKINFKEPFLLDAILALCTKKILTDKIDYEKINSFRIDKHKVEEFYDRKNRLWIDDSKATNYDATLNALIPYYDKKIHLILGGDDKGVDLNILFETISKLNLIVYAIGSNYYRIITYCKSYNIEVLECRTLDIAVSRIDENLQKDDIAILSPAAASLDQYSSYLQRGEEFKKFVFNLS